MIFSYQRKKPNLSKKHPQELKAKFFLVKINMKYMNIIFMHKILLISFLLISWECGNLWEWKVGVEVRKGGDWVKAVRFCACEWVSEWVLLFVCEIEMGQRRRGIRRTFLERKNSFPERLVFTLSILLLSSLSWR